MKKISKIPKMEKINESKFIKKRDLRGRNNRKRGEKNKLDFFLLDKRKILIRIHLFNLN